MTDSVLLLWRPAPTTDALVRAVAAWPGFDHVEDAKVGRLAAAKRPRLVGPVRWVRRRRARTGRLLRVRLGSELDGADATADAVAAALSSPPPHRQVVLLLPSEGHQAQQVYREHVLAGGIDEFTPFRLREDLAGTVTRWREAVQAVVTDHGGRVVVVGGEDTDVELLAAATDLPVDQLRPLVESPSGISARGLEILRRMNAFTRDGAERKWTRRFCQKTFPAADPQELEIVEDHPWATT